MKFKYTEYIIKGDIVDVNSLVSKNNYLRVVTVPIATTVAIAGVIILSGFIPMTIVVDSTRQVRLFYIWTKRKYKVNYVFLIPVDKFDEVLRKLNIKFSLHNELRKNEENLKTSLVYVHSHVKNIFTNK
jgi:hypothetical protein